jgi:hypothetical protein
MEPMSIFYCVLGTVIVNYIILVPVFYYILTEKVESIEAIIASRSARNRPVLVAAHENAKKDVILAFFWPFLLMRGKRHDFRKKR